MAHCVSMQKQRVTFLSEECPPEQIEEMEKFYERPISGKTKKLSLDLMAKSSVRRSCRNKHHQHLHRPGSSSNTRGSEKISD